MHHTRSSRPFRQGLSALLAAALLGGGLTAAQAALAPTAALAAPVPPTRTGLTASIEALAPYVGQAVCDPVAKPGVVAFRDLLLRTYPGTGSLGIVRDCGSGDQSEHKEGRAFDWAVSVNNPAQVADVNAVVSWLTATDSYGNRAAMARRLGVMYMIWNHRIWKAYDDRGWQAYSGTNPHTDHVHFSFGWNAARKTTSYWDGTVAAVDFGPRPPVHVTPVAQPSNLAVLRTYGSTTVKLPTSGAAVKAIQTGLHRTADGTYGPETAAAAAQFQQDQHLSPTGVFGPTEWARLFPKPVIPFGRIDAVTTGPAGSVLRGWAVDADTSDPLSVTLTVDGTVLPPVLAAVDRPDIGAAYPDTGPLHGYLVPVTLADGPHTVCAVAANAPGTPGSDGDLGCKTLTVDHSPAGALDTAVQQLDVVHVTGWAVDPDSAAAPAITLTVDGAPSGVTPTATTRTDIGARYPGVGDQHGLAADLTLPQGSHTVCLQAANIAGTAGADSSLGCLTATVQHDPVGAVESAAQGPDGVTVSGWALDPDSATALPVALTVDGVATAPVLADQARSDLTTYPAVGTAHGFSTVLTGLTAGSHTVCATAPNAAPTPGTTGTLGCRTVVVRHDPLGGFEWLRTAPGVPGASVRGWALDPDTASSSTVALTVDGGSPTTVPASGDRPDLGARYPLYGAAHGLTATLSVPVGRHTVCADAVDVAGTPGANVRLGCKVVTISTPVGTLDGVNLSGRTALVHGWTIDPDTAASNGLAVYVDGRIVRSLAATVRRADLLVRMPGYGATHGFAVPVGLAPGTHAVCAKALNLRGTPGTHVSLGCRTLVVR